MFYIDKRGWSGILGPSMLSPILASANGWTRDENARNRSTRLEYPWGQSKVGLSWQYKQ
jgi:hypothetical protein